MKGLPLIDGSICGAFSLQIAAKGEEEEEEFCFATKSVELVNRKKETIGLIQGLFMLLLVLAIFSLPENR